MITAFTGILIYRRLFIQSQSSSNLSTVVKRATRITEEPKMVILIRTDLNMTKGKATAQACHAVLAAYKDASRRDPDMLEAWEQTGQAKVTLKVESQDEMMQLVKKAKDFGVTAQYIRDAGRTQLAPNTVTVAAIGPAPKTLLDLVTGHLKLY